MSWIEFFSNVIGSISWPFATVSIVIILRSPIQSLILMITRLKYKDVEINFGKELKELQQVAETTVPKLENQTKEESERTLTFSEEIEKVAEIAPSAAISLAWSRVEREMYAAVLRLKSPPSYSPYASPYKNLMFLREHSNLDTNDFHVLDRMRRLRNEVAHSQISEVDINADEVREYAYLAAQLVHKLKNVSDDVDNKTMQPTADASTD
jgi:hypothetical protein